MSRGATLSVLGLYKSDPSLFSEMVYPSGFTNDEKQTTVGNILADCAELECLYTDPDFMKTMIGLWSKLNISVWERIFTASEKPPGVSETSMPRTSVTEAMIPSALRASRALSGSALGPPQETRVMQSITVTIASAKILSAFFISSKISFLNL